MSHTKPPRACPICRRPATERYAPFCSGRCRDRDLARWFTDGYSVPGPLASAEDLSLDDGARD